MAKGGSGVRAIVIALLLPFLSTTSGLLEPLPTERAGAITGTVVLYVATASTAASTTGTLAWPLRGPIMRGYEQPSSPYAAGHRGIDIGAAYGTPVRAAADGVVHFAGKVAGSLFVSIDHAHGLQTTYSWVSEVDTNKGAHVQAGDAIAMSGYGHPGSTEPTHLHFGVKDDGDYVDPMLYLSAVDVVDLIHLAPLAA
jgi:murein DD-endopeptidase MepM/ murein hydrolase activator NlpD